MCWTVQNFHVSMWQSNFGRKSGFSFELFNSLLNTKTLTRLMSRSRPKTLILTTGSQPQLMTESTYERVYTAICLASAFSPCTMAVIRVKTSSLSHWQLKLSECQQLKNQYSQPPLKQQSSATITD